MLLNEKICGLGDPENLLYLPNKMDILNRQIQYGGNSLYFHLLSGKDWGWGGDWNGSPFINNDPSKPFDLSRMADWQAFLGTANANGIWSFAFLYDDDCDPFGGDTVSTEEDQYIQQLVYYLGALDRLVWVIAEEYQEKLSRRRASAIAERLHHYDRGRHTIGIHQHSGLQFHFGGDPHIKLFMVQWIGPDRHAIYHGMSNALSEARGRYQIILSESTHSNMDWYGNGDEMRRKNWACLMSGVTGVMVYTRGDTRLHNLTDRDFKWLGYQNTWTRSIPRIYEMAPMPWTARHATDYVLKDPDEDRWMLYTVRPGALGAGPFSPADYEISWFDPVSGGGLNERQFLCGMVELNRMAGIGQEAVVYIRPV